MLILTCLHTLIILNWTQVKLSSILFIYSIACPYLWYILENVCFLLSPDGIELRSAVPPPHTKAEMHSFLGMTGYCRHWIHGYTALDSPSYCSAPEPLHSTENLTAAFRLKGYNLSASSGACQTMICLFICMCKRLMASSWLHLGSETWVSLPPAGFLFFYAASCSAGNAILFVNCCILDYSNWEISPIVMGFSCHVFAPYTVLQILNTSAIQHMNSEKV